MSMPDPLQIAAVRSYLEHKFPGDNVQDTHVFSSEDQIFRVAHGLEFYLVEVTLEFFRFNSPEQIARLLGEWKLAETMRQATHSRILVTTDGLRIENR